MSLWKVASSLAFVLYLAVTFPQEFMAQQGANAVLDEAVTLAAVESEAPRNRTATAYRGRDGHFEFNAMLNGRSVRVLVDTGASSVAINRSTAKRIGVRVDDKDFRHLAETANGRVPYAKARIRSVKVGGVKVKNVDALVLADSALSNTLLGMSFLNKLKKFEFDGNRLTLRQ